MKSSIGLFYQITVRDKKGEVVRKTRLRRSRSFVLGFLQLLQVMTRGITVNIKDTLGAGEDIPIADAVLRIAAGAGNTDIGILVGTGVTAPDNADFVMETLIADGNGAGQLEYAAISVIAAQEVGANVDYQIIRSMQNLSGGAINVTEVGMVAQGTALKFIMIIHDVVTAVPVADGETITVTYTLRTTV